MTLPRLTPVDLINLAVEAPDSPMHVGAVAVLAAMDRDWQALAAS
jgi:hypothetical protein